jgi:hypothetical protein
MNGPSLIIAALALAALASFIWTLRFAIAKHITREEAQRRMTEFNIQALTKLLDASERDFLRARLPNQTFRRLHRRRMRVALMYLSDLSNILSAFDPSSIGEMRTLVLRARFQVIRMWLFPSITAADMDLATAFERLNKEALE